MTAAAAGAGRHMRREIHEQAAVWRRLLARQRGEIEAAARLVRDTDPELVVFAARGSSDHAAMHAQYLVHARLGVPAMLATPSSVTGHGARLRYPRTVMIAVSQSGESPDLIETVRAAREAGAAIVAVTNEAASSVAALGHVHVPLAAGPELSVAATKTYTAELVALTAIIGLAAGDRWHELERAVEDAAAVAEQIVAEAAARAAAIVDLVVGRERVLVVGRGYSMATAREGALKLMETNGIAASGWSSADATHGPLGQVGPGTLVVLLGLTDVTGPAVAEFGRAAARLGGELVTLAPSGAADAGEEGVLARWRLPEALTTVDPALRAALEIVPLQVIALEAALRRGLDPDVPAGLAKVTRTF